MRPDVAQQVGPANCDYSYHMAVTWWGEKVWDDMPKVVRQGGDHQLQALHGLQGRADGERRRDVRQSFRRVAIWAAWRWSMPRTAMWWPN
jgi:hypothetical protein